MSKPMIRHVAKWFCKSTAIFLLGIPVTLLGLPIVALALPFRVKHPETQRSFTDPRQMPGVWRLETLPRWAKWWSNEFDGAWGDKRGWWNNKAMELWGKRCYEFLPMWWWLAIRNPANYWSRVVTGCDVSKCDIVRLAGQDLADEDNPGWSFLVATERDTGREFHSLQFFFPWGDGSRGVLGRFGWKIKMAHNGTLPADREQDRIKGSVYRILPWKSK